ncbi:hypothetical protein Tco_0322462 [Tanacetum coccineum]
MLWKKLRDGLTALVTGYYKMSSAIMCYGFEFLFRDWSASMFDLRLLSFVFSSKQDVTISSRAILKWISEVSRSDEVDAQGHLTGNMFLSIQTIEEIRLMICCFWRNSPMKGENHKNIKAFRVFNSRTRIVEENLHIRFSESTPNAVGLHIVYGFTDPKSSHDDGSKPSSDDGKKVDEDPRKDSECKDH